MGAISQPIQDPYFAATTGCPSACTNPFWEQYDQDGDATIGTEYYVLSGGWNSGEGHDTAQPCGYAGCDDASVYQPITLPADVDVTSATLSFEAAAACFDPGPCGAGSDDLFVGLSTESNGSAGQNFFNGSSAGDYSEMAPETISGGALLTFIQDNPGQTADVLIQAATSGTDTSEFFVTAVTLTLTQSPPPPTNVTATSTGPGQAIVSWTPPAGAVAAGVTGYTVTTYNDQGVAVGTPESVSGTSTTFTGLPNGTPWYFSVASVNAVGDSAAVESNSVTPLSGGTSGAALTAVSQSQYLLPNSDGTTWQVMDASKLAFTIDPSSTENVLLSANADLWTVNAGYNQDVGIQVTPGSGTPVLAAWKEAGGFAGTFSPNAAFVETVYPMNAGTTYTVQIVWKTNIPAIGATIAAGAGPIGSSFSPTRLTADVLPVGYQSVVSTEQYASINSNGSAWAELDAAHLVTTAFSPSSAESVVVSGNADLWTANAGYNQDLGIFVSVNGATPTLVAWKESGGFAGTFSPNAAFVQALYPLTAGTYTVELVWKSNTPIPVGDTIYIAAGSSATGFSPTSLISYLYC
jgi:hypothetical protein